MNKASTLKDFQIIARLGEGSFASVYKVRRSDDQTVYALKKVKIGQMGTKEKENSLNQVRILASTSHPNIINYKEAFFDDSSETLCIVMELAEGGDVLKRCTDHKKAKTYFTEAEIWKALLHMAKGLKALHDMNILHRDLKCANVFVSNDGVYKLGDLNVSKVSKKGGLARTHTGTPYYTSPEVWKDREYDLKCDIWSLGCVIYEMATLKPPFCGGNLKELYNKIQKGIFDRIPVFYSDDLQNMIAHLIKVNPSLRPTTIEILNNSTVLKYTSPKDYYKPEPKQGSLLKTIMVPKNIKQIKDLLPGSKYDIKLNDCDTSVNKRVQERANSVRSLRGNESERKLQVLNSFRKMTPSRNKDYSIDNINKSKEGREPEVNRGLSKEKERQREKQRERQRAPLMPIPSIPRNRSKQHLVDISSNKIKQWNLQLRKEQAEISKNVARALQKVSKVDKIERSGGNISARNIPSKPRSQSMDKIEKGERQRSKENKHRIFAPPLPRPPSRNNLDKKYLPPQPRMY